MCRLDLAAVFVDFEGVVRDWNRLGGCAFNVRTSLDDLARLKRPHFASVEACAGCLCEGIQALSPRTTPPPLPNVQPPTLPSSARAESTQSGAAVTALPVRGGWSLLRRALIGLAVMITTAVGAAWLLDASIDKTDESGAAPSSNRKTLAAIKSWAYQLEVLQVERLAGSSHDLLVVDELRDDRFRGSEQKILETLKRKPDGSGRLVLSYFSIGEAENFRPYWRSNWTAASTRSDSRLRLAGFTGSSSQPVRVHSRFAAGQSTAVALRPSVEAPVWLGPENPEWRGNFTVRYWHPDWKALLFGKPSSALDRVMASGFDGIYLDRADVYNLWRREQPSAKDDMIDLVVEIAAYARSKKPNFLIVLQNADELLSSPRLRRVLDGAAKEDLLYGTGEEGRENPTGEVQSSLRYLRQARTDGLPVLVVEYLADISSINSARNRIESEGFVAYIGPRALNMLVQKN